MQEFGGDPVTASVVTDKGALIPTRLADRGDGTYEIRDVAVIKTCILIIHFLRAKNDKF